MALRDVKPLVGTRIHTQDQNFQLKTSGMPDCDFGPLHGKEWYDSMQPWTDETDPSWAAIARADMLKRALNGAVGEVTYKCHFSLTINNYGEATCKWSCKSR